MINKYPVFKIIFDCVIAVSKVLKDGGWIVEDIPRSGRPSNSSVGENIKNEKEMTLDIVMLVLGR